MFFENRENRELIEKELKRYELRDYVDEGEIIMLLRGALSRQGDSVIKPKELYQACIAALINNSKAEHMQYVPIVTYARDVYKELLLYGEDTKDFEERAELFFSMFRGSGFIVTRCFAPKIMNLFFKFENYRRWAESAEKYSGFRNVVNACERYGVETRCYFTEEETFTSNLIYVTALMVESGDADAVYRYQKNKVEHMVGIYEVDEAMIREAELSMKAAKDTIDRSKDILQVLEERMSTVDSTTEHAVNRIKQITSSEIELTQSKIKGIEARLQEAYDKFADTQRESVLYEKQKLVDEIVRETDEKLESFRKSVQGIVNMANLEMSKLNQDSGDMIKRIDNYIKDDAKLKEMMKNGSKQENLLNKLEKLTILNDSNLELLNSRFEAEYKLMAERAAAEAKAGTEKTGQAVAGVVFDGANQGAATKNTGKGAGNKGQAAASQVVIVPGAVSNGAAENDDEQIPPVNYLLDENIDFKDRFEYVKKAKKKMEQEGEHFHKMFDDVLTAVMENVNPYLIGPSGCGKTYMVNQICRLLNTSFIDIGYINEEYDILGFQTANGGYSKPNFYRCYKYGKIAFCDELDNGNSRATVKLNSFLSNTKGAGYNFPNGEHVKRHGNFRIIAAGNTSGNGADSVYNTREKIEESVQQRFIPIYIGYDNEIERKILGDYKDWFEFVVIFRKATDEWSRKSHCVAAGIVTTRDTARIRKYLDNGSFTMEKILDYEFIQTKDESYLAFIADYIKENGKKRGTIENCFIDRVDKIRKGEIER